MAVWLFLGAAGAILARALVDRPLWVLEWVMFVAVGPAGLFLELIVWASRTAF